MTKTIRNKIPGFNLPARFARFLAIVAVAASVIGARADVQMFMKFITTSVSPDLTMAGDSQDDMYNGADGWFAIKGFDIKVQNAVSVDTTGAGIGKAKLVEFSLNKDIDSRTPTLFKGLSAGKHWQYALVAVRRPGVTTGPAYLTYTFEMVFATDQEWAVATTESALNENVQFAYGALKIAVTTPNSSGTALNSKQTAWDQIKNSDDFTDPAN